MKKKSSHPVVLLPENCLLIVTGTDKYGDYLATTVNPDDNPYRYPIFVLDNKRIKPALTVNDKFLARMQLRKDKWFAKPLHRVVETDADQEVSYGIVAFRNGKYYLTPSEKNQYLDYLLDNPHGAKAGDYVKFALRGARRFKEAVILKNYGKFDLHKATSTLILEKYNIPHTFSTDLLSEADNLPRFNAKLREDLSQVPFVTIDDESAKDFDDAIYAHKISGGYRLIVAIADVAFYVRHHGLIDKEALERGNSVYLPNMVVPMLPETLCNGVCSLRPKEVRAVIACFMEIDLQGNIKNYDFKRALIKSAARLTYSEVQNALDGHKSDNIAPVFKSVVQPLFDAYMALNRAREKRGALNLETTELKLRFDKKGNLLAVEPEARYIAHQIVEEFMIAANVCAAKALGRTKIPTMYRIHEKPLEEKLQTLEPLLHDLGLKMPDTSALKPQHFNHIIELCASSRAISDFILRLQCQAKYSPQNIGHFGLGLSDYVHFTSPIRRYADLLIHRALIKAFNLPDGGELSDDYTIETYEALGEHLCITERRAVNAERDLTARFVSAFLTPSIGAEFAVKISGLANAGIFVCIENLGAEGLIPMSSLPADNYILSDSMTELYGEKYQVKFAYGQVIKAKLTEASPISGGLIFKYIDPECGVDYYEKGNHNFAKKSAPRRQKQQTGKDSFHNRRERKQKIKASNHRKKKTVK